MPQLKLTSWNIKWLNTMVKKREENLIPQRRREIEIRYEQTIRELTEIDSDILCMIGGPRGDDRIRQFAGDIPNCPVSFSKRERHAN